MGETGFKVDTRSFDINFDKVIKNVIPKLVHKGLFNAANEALRDADVEAPHLPIDEHNLQGSREVHLPKNLNDLFVEFGYNIVYAARLHEDGLPSWNWTRPGSGPKFLTTKLIRNKDKYMRIVALTVENGQRSV